jgi:hypothetical protein
MYFLLLQFAGKLHNEWKKYTTDLPRSYVKEF